MPRSGLFAASAKRTYAEFANGVDDDDEDGDRARQRNRTRGKESSLLRRLRERELCSAVVGLVRRQSARETFCSCGLKAELDTFDPDSLELNMPFQRSRSRIVEVISYQNVVFALTKSGICVAFDRDKLTRICYLNSTADEVIRSLFINKTNHSLITVSVFREDNFSSLKCRSTYVQYILRNQPKAGFALFETECLRWPGFVEFDDVNSKILTFSTDTQEYKVWSLVNYRHLFTIRDPRVQEIKISPNTMLLIFPRSPLGGYVPLQILDMETGKLLREFNHLLHRHRKIDFIEHFNEKLLVKQDRENLQIVDVTTGGVVEVVRSQFLTPNAFIFLYDTQMFITFRNRVASAWNFLGELVTNFEDHELWFSDCQGESHNANNNIYVLSQQDLIISFCRNRDCKHGSGDQAHGSINISSVSQGRLVGKITCDTANANQLNALRGISSLYYNEERQEICTGNKDGVIHMWSR